MKLLIASPIDSEAIARLRQQHDVVDATGVDRTTLERQIQDREALIFRSGVLIDGALMAKAPGLKLLIRAGSGLDNLDMEYVTANGLALVRTPGPGARAVAELAFSLMLALARQLLTADRLLREGHWAKHRIEGHLLDGKTLGIYGCGNIGGNVGRMGAAWGMRVLGCVRGSTDERRDSLRTQQIELVESDEVLAQADFLSIHVPLNDATRGLIDASALAKMKQGAFLVNLARGGVVVEQALHEALVSGHLRGAGTDVHEREGEGLISPLADLPNVILTPHMGAGTVDSQRVIGELVIEAVATHLART